jgi:demethylmenaquinone methyltransferase / 2-methoxy-6-polyprenyl-1,4-benzoquinol methylase
MRDQKAVYVRALFGAITPYYDLMNRLMTGGLDQRWRRQAAAQCMVPSGGRILDVAAGTADLSLALAHEHDTATVFALDFSAPMLQRGSQKVGVEKAGQRIAFALGDALQLPFLADSFDAVTSAFMMRNVARVDQAFAEMTRVVRPRGRVVCLELTQPTFPLFRLLFWWYFSSVIPRIGQLVSRNAEAYRYLPQSLACFVSADELREKMEKAGLSNVSFRKLMAGTVALHVGTKV